MVCLREKRLMISEHPTEDDVKLALETCDVAAMRRWVKAAAMRGDPVALRVIPSIQLDEIIEGLWEAFGSYIGSSVDSLRDKVLFRRIKDGIEVCPAMPVQNIVVDFRITPRGAEIDAPANQRPV